MNSILIGNDITDLSKLPDSKRALFEDEDNYEYDSLSAYTVNLKDLVTYDKLGSGCFGSVHRGTYKFRDKRSKTEVEIPVAIKQLNIDTDESRQEIIKEADIMKSLKNPHIIKFIGMCFDQSNGRLMIVLELAKLGIQIWLLIVRYKLTCYRYALFVKDHFINICAHTRRT